MRRGFLRSLRKNFHWKCFLLTVFIDACIVYIVYCRDSYEFDRRTQLQHAGSSSGIYSVDVNV